MDEPGTSADCSPPPWMDATQAMRHRESPGVGFALLCTARDAHGEEALTVSRSHSASDRVGE
jgi:hypothetical protein